VNKGKWSAVLALLLVAALLLAGCEGYTEMNSRSSEHQDGRGGDVSASVGKANGTSTKDLETQASGAILDASVTLSVGAGSYKIELLGDNDEVTLALEAHGGETVSGQGWMVADAFGDASYRVTAVEAEDVQYQIEYTFR
jgi:outer membrane usher protein FimD/PapC